MLLFSLLTSNLLCLKWRWHTTLANNSLLITLHDLPCGLWCDRRMKRCWITCGCSSYSYIRRERPHSHPTNDLRVLGIRDNIMKYTWEALLIVTSEWTSTTNLLFWCVDLGTRKVPVCVIDERLFDDSLLLGRIAVSPSTGVVALIVVHGIGMWQGKDCWCQCRCYVLCRFGWERQRCWVCLFVLFVFGIVISIFLNCVIGRRNAVALAREEGKVEGSRSTAWGREQQGGFFTLSLPE